MTSGLSGDDWARAVYLLLLLLGLLGFFSFRGGRGMRGVRDALIWGLIFLMVVLAYGFRDTIRGELMPSRALEVGTDAMELRRQSDGHFNARVTVNGTELRFIVDTGATGLVLARADAEAAGIDTGALSFTNEARTANGVARMAPVRLDRVRFGPLDARDVAASVSEGGLDISLLGMAFLDRFSRIEIAGDRMRLYF